MDGGRCITPSVLCASIEEPPTWIDQCASWGEALASYARLCGRTLARAHARSADPAIIAGYMGKRGVLDDALASFAMAYAVRTQDDYEQLVKAKRGIIRKAA